MQEESNDSTEDMTPAPETMYLLNEHRDEMIEEYLAYEQYVAEDPNALDKYDKNHEGKMEP